MHHPEVVETADALRRAVAAARAGGRTVGLVPTMGALHAGHASLIERASSDNDFVVVSIFVNPTQFGPREDFQRYPRDLDHDLVEAGGSGADLVFHPPVDVMYRADFRTFVEVTGLQDVLEGASRPGHFRGVCTVVLKLFNLVQPDRAYFGQKDAQQAGIIRQMVRDLAVPVEVVVCPTVRESDGLALSSRNHYLDHEQRRNATVLSRALEEARSLHATGETDAATLQKRMADLITATPGAVLDYAVVVDADTLRPIERVQGPTLLALAVRFGTTRLIDNALVGEGASHK
jgi:pantoate--beta-alanine ligase